jgi:hypothetical protein
MVGNTLRGRVFAQEVQRHFGGLAPFSARMNLFGRPNHCCSARLNKKVQNPDGIMYNHVHGRIKRMSNTKKILTISEVIDLVSNNKFELPSVQRGFVWKPSQIENLWDSLLRGFPAGAIITNEMESGKLQLLDGQQRTTSIALGFAEHTDSKCEVLHSSTEHIRIFIDTRIPDREKEGRKYAFRVITRSHPWGYQRVDNTRPLKFSNKSKALELWGKEDPFAENILGEVYPYDAVAPLPLNIFTNAAIKKKPLYEVEQELLAWVRKMIKDAGASPAITTWLDALKGRQPSQPSLKVYSVADIYAAVQEMIRSYVIPVLPLPPDLLGNNGDNSAGAAQTEGTLADSGDEQETAEEHDDVEEVFVRLNSAGTPLGGEELNYSILKAGIDKNFQKEMENACEGIMKPSRFITLAYRLHQNDSINLRIKPTQFQREIRNQKSKREEFQNFIKKILDTGFMDKLKGVLKHGDKNIEKYEKSVKDYRLPYPLFIKVAAASQGEIMFMLMYRLLYGNGTPEKPKPDVFEYNTEKHRKMIGIILLFMWNGKDGRSRYNKLLNRIWGSVKILSSDEMWSNHIVGVAYGDEELKEIPADNKFFDIVNHIKAKTRIFDKIKKGGYSDFVKNVMCNKDLLLWIQRKFLATSFFQENLFTLDDTNVPFDWDHISPENFVSGRHNIPSPLKDIYQQPANLRVWPYRLNRADHDCVPAVKFAIEKMADAAAERMHDAFPGYKDREINEYLPDASFCNNGWCQYNEEWLHRDRLDAQSRWQEVYALILNRWRDMFVSLSGELRLNALVERPENLKLADFLDENTWDDDDDDTMSLHVVDEVYLYISYTENNDIKFGFYEINEQTRLKEDLADANRYKWIREEEYHYIFTSTCIACPSVEDSYYALMHEIATWIDAFPQEGIAQRARQRFMECRG